jgi:hypothetical protein
MLWWLIGMWLASGLVIPVLWLAGVAGRRIVSGLSNAMRAKSAPVPSPNGVRTLPKRSRVGRFSLAGLVGIGALVLMLVGSFSDPITRLQELPSVLTSAPAPASEAAITPPSGEADRVLSVEPADGNVRRASLDDSPNQADAATPLVAVEQPLGALPVPPEQPDAARGRQHGHARGPSNAAARNSRPVRAHITRSVRGTWLFPPNPGNG